MSSNFVAALNRVVVNPGASDARAHALEALEILRVETPTDESLTQLKEYATVFTTLGLGAQTSAALEPWRESFAAIIRKIEVLLNVTEEPASASYALQAAGKELDELKGISVINAFMRGDLDGAVRLARENDWFMNDIESTVGLVYGVWTLALQGEFQEATTILERWKEAHLFESARADHQVRRVEATMASYRGDFEGEVRLLEEALAIAREHDLGLEFTFTESALAAAYAHAGEFELADELASSWGESETGTLLDAYRHLARADVALISGRWDEALTSAEHVLSYYNMRRNAVLFQHIRFVIALASPEETYRDALDQLAQAVGRLPTKRMMERLDDLERLYAGGVTNPRGARVRERTRHRSTERALVRVWYARSAVSADLYVDLVRRVVYVGGCGPFFPACYPKRMELLECLASKPEMAAPAAEVYRDVWGGDYDAERHENKLHVTVHRLRQLLSDWCDRDVDLVGIREGCVVLADVDVRVLEFEDTLTVQPNATLDERVMNLLRAGEPMAAGELERLLDVSRSSLHLAIKRLLATNVVERQGGGRSVRYVARLQGDT